MVSKAVEIEVERDRLRSEVTSEAMRKKALAKQNGSSTPTGALR